MPVCRASKHELGQEILMKAVVDLSPYKIVVLSALSVFSSIVDGDYLK